MAIGIKNDYGKVVAAVGAPGSFADVMTRYPKLTQRLIYLYDSRAPKSDAVQEITDAGITDDDVLVALMTAAYYLPPSKELGYMSYLDWKLYNESKS